MMYCGFDGVSKAFLSLSTRPIQSQPPRCPIAVASTDITSEHSMLRYSGSEMRFDLYDTINRGEDGCWTS